MLKVLRVFYVVLSLCVFIHKNNAASPDKLDGKELKKILDLEGRCSETTCRDFQYENLNEVAYFDLKAEVRINQESTYDIIHPLKYDVLVFENSKFTNFPLHLFYTFDIRELDMRNCAIKILTWESFLMAGNLMVLLLSDNQIHTIEKEAFKFARNLQFLFLDSNRIHTLDSGSFLGLTELRFLDLRGNRLQQLPEGIFDHLPHLGELNLAQNRLRTLSNEIFTRNPNLNLINLRSNKLRDLGEYAFKNQIHLQLLDLSQNYQLGALVTNLNSEYLVATNCSLYRVNIYGPVKNVDMRDNQILELYFSEPESLEFLNLRNNALQQIASLSRARNLRELELSDNPGLRSLPEPWIINSIEKLDIGNTSIATLPFAALQEAQINLRYLNVSHNKIEEIDPSNFKYLQQLTHFYIHANNWNCFNLRILMDMLIVPSGMSYSPDVYDPEFPGEYVNGVACMYRIQDDQSIDEDQNDQQNTGATNHIIKMQQLNTINPQVAEMEQQLKTIVTFFQDRLDEAFKQIDDLNTRLENFERINATIWNRVTIST